MEATNTPATPASTTLLASTATPTDKPGSWAGVVIVSCLALAGFLAYNTWTTQRENQKLGLQNVLYQAEHRILKDEIYQKERALADRPTYEQGYKDALVRVGGPQAPGAYQDGWDDALKIYGTENGYADGYHAAIKQFGYTKTTAMARWLIPEPTPGTGKDKEGVPTKVDKK